MTVYHYAPGIHLPKIALTHHLRPGTSSRPLVVDPKASPWGRDALWFSILPTWEPTATKLALNPYTGEMRPATDEEMGGRYRFACPAIVAPLTWGVFCETSGIHPARALALTLAAKRQGSDPATYRATYEPVSLDLCEITRWLGGEWRPL